MNAVILAAGVASRLRPLTDHIPKCLLPVGGKSILERTIENLRKHDIHKYVIVTGYRENQIRDFVEMHFPTLPVTFISNPSFASTNNIYSLWLTRESILDADMLLLDSDIIFDDRIIALLQASGHENCLAITSGKTLGAEEIKVRIDDTGAVVEIGKEVVPAEAIGESIGIEKFGRTFLGRLFEVLNRKILVESNVNQFYEAAFQEVINGGQHLFVVDVGDLPCMEIDTIDDLEAARSMTAP